MTTRPESASHIAAVRDVNEHAFGRPNEADLVEDLRADPAWIPDLSLVAESDSILNTQYSILNTQYSILAGRSLWSDR